MPHRTEGKDVFYPCPAALDWFYARKFKPDVEEDDEDIAKLVDSERRKAAADAEISEMRRDQMRGKLITDVEAAAEVQSFCETIMSSLRAAPSRHAGEVLNLTEPPKAIEALQSIMERAIDEARTAITAYGNQADQEDAA